MINKDYLYLHNIFFITLFICVNILYLGADSHYWGLQKKTAEEILYEVGMGITDGRTLNLTAEQRDDIKRLILLNPEGYNGSQKYIMEDHYSEKILYKVGMGLIKPSEVKLTKKQFDELQEIINLNPLNYNDAQKSIGKEKSGKEILEDVGMGRTDPNEVSLSINQYNEVKLLIKNNPQNYNSVQKLLLQN